MNKDVCKQCCLRHRRDEGIGFWDESPGWWNEVSDESLWSKKTIGCPDIIAMKIVKKLPDRGVDLMLKDEFIGSAEEATMEDLLPPDWCWYYLEHTVLG